MYDLENSQHRKELAVQIRQDIEAYSKAALTEPPRTYLGASVIGDECSRHLWYAFRWIGKDDMPGRILRLFERGKLEEPRIFRWLRGIGCEVWETDGNGKQFRTSDIEGHFGGGFDAAVRLPQRYQLSEPCVFLNEDKTMATKQFQALLAETTVQIWSPKYYAQMCVYGFKWGFKYGLFVGVNKNDDDLYIEILPLDWDRAKQMLDKAQYIITSKTPPQRISENASYYTCKFCAHGAICHFQAEFEKNCRNCVMSSPGPNATWVCNHPWHIHTITAKEMPVGCNDYERIAT